MHIYKTAFHGFSFFFFKLHSQREGSMNTTISKGAGVLACPPHGVLPLGVSKNNLCSLVLSRVRRRH